MYALHPPCTRQYLLQKIKEIKHTLGTKYEALHNFNAYLALVLCCIILVELKLVSIILV